MHLTLWIIAGILAIAFLAGGIGKLILPKDKIAATPLGGWADDFTPGAIKAIGALEAMAALGLIIPPALDIAPVLAPLAAVGLVLMMAGAAIVHLRRRELKVIVANLTYLALAVFVAWGRFGPESVVG